LINFYPERADIVKEAEGIAAELGGKLRPPHLSWKYSWIRTAFGWRAAKNTALEMRKIRWSLEESLDRMELHIRGQKKRSIAADSASTSVSGQDSKTH